jgi:hypothetical protein
MTRAEKIRLANEAVKSDDRDQSLRGPARQEWSDVRRAAREAYLANKNWVGILDEFKEKDGFYTSAERVTMCAAYTEELIANAHAKP